MNPDEARSADPLIDEVRARRRELREEDGSDLDALFETINRLQREHPERVADRRRRSPAGE
jgi:hypothetical protein